MTGDPSADITNATTPEDLRLALQKHVAHQLVTCTKAADAEAWSRAYKNLQPEAAQAVGGDVNVWTLDKAFTQLGENATKARKSASKARVGAAARRKREEEKRRTDE